MTLPEYLLDPFPVPLPDGVRASRWAECPVAAVREFLDPSLARPFPPGVGQAGHDLADLLIRRVLVPYADDVIPEVPIPWEHGSSHVDAVVTGGTYEGCWEIKTTSKAASESISPTQANRRQVRIQQFLAERARMSLPGPWRIVILGKRDWSVHGPFTIDLTDEDREQLEVELHAMTRALEAAHGLDLASKDAFRDLGLECTCSCFPKPRVSGGARVDDLMQEFAALALEKKQGDTAAKRMKEIRAELGPLIPPGMIVEGIRQDAMKRRDGALVIRNRTDAA